MNLYDISVFLREHNNYEILTHNYPDGDTLGSGYALCIALQQLGKNARVITAKLPPKFEYLTEGVEEQDFTADYIISTDVAADSLLAPNMEKYLGKIDICIDHHGSNSVTAKEKFVDKYAAANCEIIYKLLMRMGVNFTKQIVDCLYTGISTDTGCFRYTNTTADTFRIAASLVELGCNSAYINKVMFETKSKEKIMLEREVYDTITYCADGKCAIVWVTLDMLKSLNIGEDEIEGLASIPRQIEGVLHRHYYERKRGRIFQNFRRTNGDIDAAKVLLKVWRRRT